jgi:cytoskeleton protein RodZ
MTESAPEKASAGALLKAAREGQGLHIAALAAAIKVAPRKLDALENDRWGELPDATFTRALAQTVCRTLKIDARPVLDLLPQPNVMALEPGNGGLNTPFEGRSGRDEPGLAGMAIRPMVLAAAVLMVAALVVYFLPPGLWSPGKAPPVAASAPMPASAAAAAATVASAGSAASAVSAAQFVAGAAASAPPTAGGAIFAAPPPDGAASAAAAAAAGLVQLSASEPSWVDVRDAGGQVLLSRNLLAGESVGLDGALPIRLVIGNATATRLAFRGRPVDLATRTRDNVARVELP